MKRFLYLALCLIITCAMTLCFVACGDETPDSSTSSSSNTTSSTGGTNTSSGDTTSSTEKPQPPAHEHTYEDVLSYDENEHFYKATCEHTDERKDAEAHTFNKITGFCVCGYYTEPSVTDAIESIVANRGSVTSGTIVSEMNDIEFNSITNAAYSYAFYDNYLYIKEESDYVNEYYYTLDKNGSVFGVIVQGSFVNRDDAAYEDNMNGPALGLNFAGDEETITYGAEDLIAALYENASENVNGDFISAYVDGMFTFGYGVRVFDDWLNYFYVVAVAFNVDAETGTLGEGAVIVQRFAQTSYTEVDGVYVLNENAQPNHTTTIAVAQSLEAVEDSENPYDPGKVLVDSFVVRDTQGNDIEETTIRIEAGGQVKIFFKDITPDTAMFKLCTTSIDIVNNEDGTTPGYYAYFNSFDNSYSFYLNDPGSYTMTVTVDGVEVVTTIEVALKVPTSISTQVYDSTLGTFNKTSKATVYAGAPLYLMSYVDPDYDGSYVAELVEATGATLTDGEIDGIAAKVFTADVAGTYTVKVTSTVKTSLSATLTITVEKAPSLEALLSGKYFGKDAYGMTPIEAEFDSQNKTATIVYKDALNGDMTATLSFTTTNGLEYTASGDDFIEEFYVSENYELVLVIDGEKYVLEPAVKEIVATGTIAVEDIINSGSNSGSFVFELEADGTFTFYKDGIVTNDITLRHDGTSYMIKVPGMGFEVALTKTEGSDEELAGSYKADTSNFGLVANVTITVDAAEEPVKESTTGTLIVEHLDNNGKYSGTYKYEIIDGAFVFYQNGEVTTNVSLTAADGVYTFKFQGVGTAQVLERVSGIEGELAGVYKCSMMLGETSFHAANVTITPDPVGAGDDEPDNELTTGTLDIKDNNTGAVSGTYIYEIVDGAFVFYKDGEVTTDIIVTINLDGTYSFQAINLMVPQVLVKVEGEDGVLAGKYNVNFAQEGLYVLTFTPGEVEIPSVEEEDEEATKGTLTVVDNSNGAVSGTYTYEIVNGAFVFYKDGEVTTDIIVTINVDGTYSFQAINLMVPQVLVKVEGESGVLAGKYNVNSAMEGLFVLTFVPEGTEVGGGDTPVDPPVEEDPELQLGANAVVVPAGGWGVEIPFTSAEGGKFTINAAEGETNAFVVIILDSGSEMISLPYTFELAAGASVMFNVCPNNYEADTIDLVITVATEQGGGEGGEVSIDGTYSSATSERPMTVVIDTAADKLTITRGGASTVTYEFTYSSTLALAVDGVVAGTVKTSAGGSSAVMNLTFNDDGTVKALTWSGKIYTDFVKQ